MKFKINSQPLPKKGLTMISDRLDRVAAGLADGELMSLTRLAVKSGMTLETCKNHGYLVSSRLSVRHSGKKYYGNAKTIAAYKAEFGVRD